MVYILKFFCLFVCFKTNQTVFLSIAGRRVVVSTQLLPLNPTATSQRPRVGGVGGFSGVAGGGVGGVVRFPLRHSCFSDFVPLFFSPDKINYNRKRLQI